MPQDFQATGKPPMIGKRLTIPEWLDYVGQYQFGETLPSRLILHHTYVPNEQQWRGETSMKGMQQYYGRLGWSAAPHVYSGPDGIWLFTPLKDVGVHAGSGNSGTDHGKFWYSIGLEMVGDFDHARPSGQVWEQAKAIMGGLSRRVNIPPKKFISFHRDYMHKSCPGWAVTKDWVWQEIDAWIKQAPPPPAPPIGQPGNPPPEVEHLIDRLLNEGYRQRSEGYNDNWAFHQYAIEHNLGMPIGHSLMLKSGNSQYNYQAFTSDTLFCEVPHWGDVHRLSEILDGSIPEAGLSRDLLEASYKSGGATLHNDWAFHQFAVKNGLGPAIGGSSIMTVDGAKYSWQVFAEDTLFNRVPNWNTVKLLSEIVNTNDAAMQPVRDALLRETYRRGGAMYHSDWAFHQKAREWSLGAPLSESYRIQIDNNRYVMQVYARDVVYSIIPKWNDVYRLSDLLKENGRVK